MCSYAYITNLEKKVAMAEGLWPSRCMLLLGQSDQTAANGTKIKQILDMIHMIEAK